MLKVGIVGLPNVGKSTLFSTLTKKQVDCENFPFCTIEPNVGIVEVPDDRVEALAQKSQSEKVIPTAIEFVDIAGLVKGAHKGEGLGNKFLANIREVDMILHVVRAFEDINVHHVDGSVDPARDVEVIETELAMADMSTVEKRLDAIKSKMKSGKTKDLEAEEAALQKVLDQLEQGHLASKADLSIDEQKLVSQYQLLTMKPLLYAVNVTEVSDAKEGVLGPGRLTMPLSIKMESELVGMSKDEAKEFLQDLGFEESGLDRVIKKCYELLNLVTYFTSGPKETRAWTIEKGMNGPQAAGKIHTDFEKGYIRAEVINWKDFIELGEVGAKEAGKLRVEGKEYIVQDGDVCHFRIAT